MAGELALDSLQRRMHALHSLYDDAVATMDIDQVNHFEREGVLPIAFSLFHIVNMMDASFMLMTGTPPLWDDGWEERECDRPSQITENTGPWTRWSINASVTTHPFSEYMRLVFARTEEWLETLDPAELPRIVIGRPFPPQVATTYSARVAGPDGITLLDAAECWIYQHGLRHMGEIKLARGLVGLGGMTS